MWLGMWLGTRWFHSVDEAQFKRYVLLFLILVSVVGMGRALLCASPAADALSKEIRS